MTQVGAKGGWLWGRSTGVFMSGYLQVCLPSIVVLLAISISPAYAQQAATITAARPECLAVPGNPTEGLRWVYRRDGHRKCWFQADEQSVKKQVRRRIAKPLPDVAAESERKGGAAVDARAELLRLAPAAPPPMPPESEINAVDDAPLDAIVPGSKQQPTIHQPAFGHDARRQVFLATLSADAPSAIDAVPSPTMRPKPAAFPVAAQVDDEQGWMATSLGVLLMAVGLILLLASRIKSSADCRWRPRLKSSVLKVLESSASRRALSVPADLSVATHSK